MYLVIVMACCRVRQDIRALNPEFYGQIARELRSPHRKFLLGFFQLLVLMWSRQQNLCSTAR